MAGPPNYLYFMNHWILLDVKFLIYWFFLNNNFWTYFYVQSALSFFGASFSKLQLWLTIAYVYEFKKRQFFPKLNISKTWSFWRNKFAAFWTRSQKIWLVKFIWLKNFGWQNLVAVIFFQIEDLAKTFIHRFLRSSVFISKWGVIWTKFHNHTDIVWNISFLFFLRGFWTDVNK